MQERKKKFPKAKLSMAQKEFLTAIFEMNSRPSAIERTQLSSYLGVSESKIKNWFQNRRAKERYAIEEATLYHKNICNEDKLFPNCNSLYLRRDRMH
ncbi:Homeobox protein HD-9 [Nosema bombycis CQ1]|uniref:Homeobox protein HD-9 n=1 Tax=Nosema bombycis (strain CQ1 / CVCC 102059) TaxID=578461 RepID=R0MIF1_NOSB1|nr:Homeobox protein HD-9 [Nosema bombycis CQ1]EOB13649.1 Homeobox protein HD-9 [Nosema bombycis CQ1]|eukprot:EOB12588.1 Homeobox protein HD-9 [Nosema bombycis CQ1]